jgi:hypothetical protein
MARAISNASQAQVPILGNYEEILFENGVEFAENGGGERGSRWKQFVFHKSFR